ncbi:tRNA lysidine(34) synthetase TilS [Pelagibacterium halotolerans]|uniref:tRNA lysidine(34) synthetase TilS n=1 Tax=Pelagibacterium halotolerans TaxID=531813 RepID=UPI00384BA5AE
MLSSETERLSGLEPEALFAPVGQEKTIGLAVSGGTDSLALMLLAADWASESSRPKVIVYTLDHGLRPEAAAETEMVARVADDLGFACRTLRWDEPKPETGLQAAAREARYRLIGAAMARDGASVLLTAHQQDDQAETVLMRLAHGSGVSGLKGMETFSTVGGVRVFRPLLEVSRVALEQVVAAAGLEPVEDPSNDDPRYERVRWRKAMPLLGDLGLSAPQLAGLAKRLRRIDAMAETVCAAFVSAHVRVDEYGVVHIDRQALSDAPEEIRIRALRRAVAIAGGLSEAPLAPVEAVAGALTADGAFSRTVAGAVVDARAHAIVIYRQAGRIAPEPVSVPVDRPLVWDGRFSIAARGPGVRVAPALAMTRARYRALFGGYPVVPVAALRGAPIVEAEDGTVIALGTRIRTPGVEISHIALTG